MDNETKAYTEEEIGPVSALERAGVGFIRITHEPAKTMELCRGIGAEHGARHCKNLFLTNKRGTRYFLLLMDPDKPYRTSEVSKKLGSSRLSFAGEEALSDVLGLHGGAVSIMGLTNPCAREAYESGLLRIAVDSDLMKWERICVHPNTETATLIIGTRELFRFITESGYEYTSVDI